MASVIRNEGVGEIGMKRQRMATPETTTLLDLQLAQTL